MAKKAKGRAPGKSILLNHPGMTQGNPEERENGEHIRKKTFNNVTTGNTNPDSFGR